MRMNETLQTEADPQTLRMIHRILTQSKRDHNWLVRYANTIYSWLKRELASSPPPNNEGGTSSTISSSSTTSSSPNGAIEEVTH